MPELEKLGKEDIKGLDRGLEIVLIYHSGASNQSFTIHGYFGRADQMSGNFVNMKNYVEIKGDEPPSSQSLESFRERTDRKPGPQPFPGFAIPDGTHEVYRVI